MDSETPREESSRGVDPEIVLEQGLQAIYRGGSAEELSLQVGGAPGERYGAGRYELREEIGRGGAGVVFRAHDKDFGEDVAVKVLHERYRGDRARIQQLADEAQIVGRLRHPGVAPLHDLGCLPDGTPYFSMKLVEGKTLAAFLDARVSPHDQRLHVLGCLLKLCQTLAYAHSRGVVHGDLRPAALMVGLFGEVQFLDWGLARILGAGEGAFADSPDRLRPLGGTSHGQGGSSSEARSQGGVLASAAYMAPERARGNGHVGDERVDVFGIGAILCEILTGEPPYVGTSVDDTFERARAADLSGVVERLGASASDRELVQIARRCLAAHPADRPRHAGVVADELSHYLASLEERVRASQLAAHSARARALEEARSKRRGIAITAGVVTVVLLGAGSWIWIRESSRSRIERASFVAKLAIEETERSRIEGRASAPGDLRAWRDARGALTRAREAVEGAAVPDEIVARVTQLEGELKAEEATAEATAQRLERGNKVVADLERLWRRFGAGFPWSDAVPEYADALRQNGIEVEVVSVEAAAESVLATGVGEQIASGLDHWALSRRWFLGAASDTWQRPLQISQRVDPDSLRNAIRKAVLEEDVNALERLAGSPEMASAAGRTRALLDAALYSLIAGKSRLARLDSRLRAVSAALAGRPRDSGAWAEAAAIFEELGDTPQRIVALRQCVIGSPEDPQLREDLGAALAKEGLLAEAARELEEGVRLAPSRESSWLLLSDVRESQGDFNEALRCAERAALTGPVSANASLKLGWLQKEVGRFEDAVLSMERGLSQGKAVPGWTGAAAAQQWIGECRVLQELNARYADFRRGATRPANNGERLLLAKLHAVNQAPGWAAQTYGEAFDWDGSLLAANYRQAARAACQVAQGQGKDTQEWSFSERVSFLSRARAWLAAGLDNREKEAARLKDRGSLLREARVLYNDAAFTPLRSPESLGFVPDAQRVELESLWKRIEKIASER